MIDENTNAPEVKEEQEQGDAPAEVSVAELHQEKPKPEKPKVVPMARLDKEIAKRKELEAKLAQYETDEDDSDEAEPVVTKLAQKLEQLEEKDRIEALNKTFMTHFTAALENAPEYKDLVNVEVIKAMAFNPANANKTYKQLIEEAYGNALTGRRTIETSTPRGGTKDGKVDMELAAKDPTYRREVLADPVLRKQYNEGLTDRVFR